MAIQSSIATTSVVLTAVPQAIPSGFYFLQDSHITVTRRRADVADATLVLNSGYTVTGAGDEAGGTITVTDAVIGDTIILTRSLPFTQETVFQEGGDQPASVVENLHDEHRMVDQQQEEKLARVEVYPVGEVAPAIPSVDDRALKFPYFDASGNKQHYTAAQVASLINATFPDPTIFTLGTKFFADAATRLATAEDFEGQVGIQIDTISTDPLGSVYIDRSSSWVPLRVITANLDALAVTEPKMADLSVATRALTAAAVTGSKIATGAVGATHYGANSVGNPALGLLAVALGNLDADLAARILATDSTREGSFDASAAAPVDTSGDMSSYTADQSYWECSVAGTFDAIAYAVGDKAYWNGGVTGPDTDADFDRIAAPAPPSDGTVTLVKLAADALALMLDEPGAFDPYGTPGMRRRVSGSNDKFEIIVAAGSDAELTLLETNATTKNGFEMRLDGSVNSFCFFGIEADAEVEAFRINRLGKFTHLNLADILTQGRSRVFDGSNLYTASGIFRRIDGNVYSLVANCPNSGSTLRSRLVAGEVSPDDTPTGLYYEYDGNNNRASEHIALGGGTDHTTWQMERSTGIKTHYKLEVFDQGIQLGDGTVINDASDLGGGGAADYSSTFAVIPDTHAKFFNAITGVVDYGGTKRFQELITTVNRHRPDVAVHVGDVAEDITDAAYTAAHKADMQRIIAQKTFPVAWTPGNHDMKQNEDTSVPRINEFFDTYDVAGDFSGNPETDLDGTPIRDKGYYVFQSRGLWHIVLNSVYTYSSPNYDLGTTQLAWLNTTLTNIATDNHFFAGYSGDDNRVVIHSHVRIADVTGARSGSIYSLPSATRTTVQSHLDTFEGTGTNNKIVACFHGHDHIIATPNVDAGGRYHILTPVGTIDAAPYKWFDGPDDNPPPYHICRYTPSTDILTVDGYNGAPSLTIDVTP